MILMELANKYMEFLVGDSNVLSNMPAVKSRDIFHGSIMKFLESLSERLIKDRGVRKYPDIISFAFWIRQRNLERLREKYKDNILKMGRGIVFHITPSNIPIQFVVSLVYGLLSGNINIVRISDREFPEVDVICKVLNELLMEKPFESLKDYICIMRYGHNDEVTGQLSKVCDARIVWGGNRTIEYIRKFPLQPRALEICFADRDSLCIIDSDKYLIADVKALAKDFYNDTYHVDQNACSSPRIIIWLGEKVEEAKKVFWSELSKELKDYDLPSIAGSEKLLKFCVLAAENRNISYCTDNAKLVRVEVDRISENLLDYKSGMGYFFEYRAKGLEEILPLLRKSCQTVSYFGVNSHEIKELIHEYGVRGVDRIVPIGHTQELSLEWDGFDMIEILSRQICVT